MHSLGDGGGNSRCGQSTRHVQGTVRTLNGVWKGASREVDQWK